jgi:3-hydroxyacyl-[acyl-carrier-protein] dehydratase
MLILQSLNHSSDRGSAEGSCSVSKNNPFLLDESRLSEVCYIELLAQLAAAAFGFNSRRDGMNDMGGYLVAIDHFSILNSACVGQHLNLTLTPVVRFRDFSTVEGNVSCENQILGTGRLKLYTYAHAGREVCSEEGNYDTSLIRDAIGRSIKEAHRTAQGAGGELIFDSHFPGFDGHFPGQPVLPAVVLLESICVLYRAVMQKSCRIVKVERSKFIQPIRPGERVVLSLSMSAHEKQTTISGRAHASMREAANFVMHVA